MKLSDISVINLIKFLVDELSKEELSELVALISSKLNPGTESRIDESFDSQPIIKILEEEREKESDIPTRQCFTRMIHMIMNEERTNNRTMNVSEYKNIPNFVLLQKKHIGKKTVETVSTAIKRFSL